MKRLCVLTVLLLCLCPLLEALAESSGVEWSFDTSTLTTADGITLSTISVSPSGRYIACADRTKQNMESRNAAGAANPMGRLPDALCLFERSGEGYELYKSIPIDTDNMLELSSMIGGGSAIAWSPDESRLVITGAWGPGAGTLQYLTVSHTNLYLLDMEEQSFTQLTFNGGGSEHCVLPVWEDEKTIRFLRTQMVLNGFWNSLCEIDAETLAEKNLAGLFSNGGSICAIYSWGTVGEDIYYTLSALSPELSGLYVSRFGAFSADARLLVSVENDLVQTEMHPYCRNVGVFRVEISPDEKLACLSVVDNRAFNRDFPLVDAPQPQSDPAKAVSPVSGRPWVPCHNVFLYDIENEKLIDPFTDASLDPAKAIVTGACFGPDGQSLICAVFGDGGGWNIGDFTRTTFYRVSLADFSAARLGETELYSSVWFPEGISMLGDGTLCVQTDQAPYTPARLLALSAPQ